MKYHSALHKPNSYPLVGAIQLGNSFAFSHDLMRKDVPSDYNDCDIFIWNRRGLMVSRYLKIGLIFRTNAPMKI